MSPLRRAAEILRETAQSVKSGNYLHSKGWLKPEARELHDEMLALAAELERIAAEGCGG